MSVQYRVLVSCDAILGGDCHGVYECRGASPRDVDDVVMELLRRGWVRTLRTRQGGERPTPDDRALPYDTCPACSERVLRPVPHERQEAAP